MDNATAALARMNMILHDSPSAEIWKDNSLSEPHYKEKDGRLKVFDFVVANPPFSNKAWTNGFNPEHDLYGRFADGIPPKKNGDYAFLLHILRSMKSTGKGAVILPHGVLFRGNAEADIRKNIIRKGYIKGIIGLPANLFYGTGIPACIIVLDKENAAGRAGIFMINASKGFVKDGNKNRLRHQDIHKIVDVFTKQIEIPKYSRMVPLSEIGDPKNDYNSNIPRYIDNTEEEDLQDISAHLLGGIPNRDINNMSAYWKVFPTLRKQLFEPSDREGYSRMKVDTEHVKATIFAHPEFEAYNKTITSLFSKWKKKNTPLLMGLKVGSHPKALIEALAEDLLAAFGEASLVDNYDVYQHLMTYWTETMQDDVYMICIEGWLNARRLRLVIEDENKKTREKPDLVIGRSKYKADLIPPPLIVARYFADEQSAIDKLKADAETISARMDELKEEHSGEDGLLEEVKDEKGNISKGNIKTRLKEIEGDGDVETQDLASILNEYLALIEKESEADKKVKDAQKALDEKVAVKYKQLSEAEVKTLVVDDKWLATLAATVQSELDRISQTLTARIKELAERYAAPLQKQTQTVEELTNKVEAHLKKMGFVWN